MANIEERFAVGTGFTVGQTTISATTGDITIASGNIIVGATRIDAASGNITIGGTTIHGTTGEITSTANVTTSGSIIVGATVLGSGSSSSSFANATISNSTINGSSIGSTSAAAAKFTTLEASGIVTVDSDILPSSNNVSNIGSATNRFNSIFVNEARLSTNTLYIGDTPILGTSQNIIQIHADLNQGISMQTTGAAGTMSFVSNAQMTHQTIGNNADILIQSNGTGSRTRMLSTTSVDITAPAVAVTGNLTVTGATTATGDLIVNGNVTVTGTQATVNAANLSVKDPIVVINYGEAGSGVTSGSAGLQFARGDLQSYRLVFQESDQSLQYGPIGSTVALADKPWVTLNAITANSSPTLGNLTVTGTVTAAQVSPTNLSTANAVITGGSVNTTPIGATTPSTGAFTTLSSNGGITGTLQTNAQPNITSVGTLSALTVTAAIAGSVTGSAATAGSATTAGTVTTAAQPNITSVGTLTALSVTGNITAGSFNGPVIGNVTGNVSGTAATVTAAAQPSITSVGTLTSLTTSGDATIGGNLTVSGTTTTINSTTITTNDLNITLANNAGSAAAADGAGITINGPVVPATITYASTDDSLNVNKKLAATSFSGSGANLTSIPNGALTNSSVTVTAGTGLSGGGAISLGGSTTISLPAVGTAVTGQFVKITTDAQGRVSATSSVSASDLTTLIGSNAVTNATNAVNATNATASAITDDTTTASAVYPIWAGGVSGNQANKVSSSKLTFVPNTGVLTSTTFSGAFSGSGANLTSIPNGALNNSSVTVTAGTGMSGGGAVSLGGTVTLTNAGVTQLTGGGGVSVSGATGSITIGSTATSANTASAIVARDASGNFTAGTITAALTGTASNATTAGGFTPSASTGVNDRIVVADATGYITNTRFYSSDTSATAGAPGTTSGVTSVMVKTTGDNYIQSGSAAAISSFLSLANSATIASTALNTASTIVARDGSGNFAAGTITATATNAKYADLAEKYLADADYDAGTVVEFGGAAEVTLATKGTRKVAGVVSTRPAYLMNSELVGVSVALQGRVPVKVVGHVKKGDMLIAAGNGRARAEAEPLLGQVIGKALENFTGVEGVIEVVVGRM